MFDHRRSIVNYLETQADKYEGNGLKAEATAVRAQASSVRAEIDIEPGRQDIITPAQAITLEVCSRFGAGQRFREVLGGSGCSEAVRMRFAAMWVIAKRFSWTQEKVGEPFGRDASSVSHALKRAEEIRRDDAEFAAVTDFMVRHTPLCENCQSPLIAG